MRFPDKNGNGDKDSTSATITALQALAWTLADDQRATRLLALTGLTADQLRANAGDPALLKAVIDFLSSHEPDLIACADALDMRPEQLIETAHLLTHTSPENNE